MKITAAGCLCALALLAASAQATPLHPAFDAGRGQLLVEVKLDHETIVKRVIDILAQYFKNPAPTRTSKLCSDLGADDYELTLVNAAVDDEFDIEIELYPLQCGPASDLNAEAIAALIEKNLH